MDGQKPLIKQGIKDYSYIRIIALYAGVILGAFASAYSLNAITLRVSQGPVFSALIIWFFYFALALALWLSFNLILTSTQNSLLIIAFNLFSVIILGLVNYVGFSIQTLLGLLGFLAFLIYGAIRTKREADESLKLNLTKLSQLQWKFASIGLIIFLILSSFLNHFSYKAFPVSEKTFNDMLKGSEPIVKSFIPVFSFSEPINKLIAGFAVSSSSNLANLPPDVLNQAISSASNEQIQNINKTYHLNLAGDESVSKVAYLISKSYYENKDETTQLFMFIIFIIIIILLLQFGFWLVGIAYYIFGLIILKLAKTIGLFKIEIIQVPKESLIL